MRKEKVLNMVLAIMLSLTSVAMQGCNKPVRPEKPSVESDGELPDEEESGTSEEVLVKEYTITYYAVEQGKVCEINPLLYLKDGNYPTTYKAGEEIYISPLKGGYVDISPNEDREFKGWYAESTCETLYSEKTTTYRELPDWLGEGNPTQIQEEKYGGFRIKTEGDLVFYAKLSCGYWYGPY